MSSGRCVSRRRWTALRGLVGTALVAGGAWLAAPAVSASSPAPAPLTVKVSGNRLVDGSGAQIVLRGADVSGTEFSCVQGGSYGNLGFSIYGDQPLSDESTFQTLASWHTNVVRIPLNEDCWLGINGVNPAYAGSNYQQAIHAEVSAAHAAGLYAILDLHWSAPGTFAAYDQQPMADADHSIAFWSSVATSFKSDPGLIFDLYNEPYLDWGDGATTWQGWLDGMTLSTVVTAGQPLPGGGAAPFEETYSWKTAGMQQMLNAIRATGNDDVVMANGVGWANQDNDWLQYEPTDPASQLIAGLHNYPGQGCAAESCWTGILAPITEKVPLLVGETGDNITSPLALAPTFLPWCDQHNVSYLGWTWNPWLGYSSDVLITNWNGTPTNGWGQYFQQHLAAVAGDPVDPVTTTTPPTTTPATTTPPTTTPPTTTPPTTAPPSGGTSSGGGTSIGTGAPKETNNPTKQAAAGTVLVNDSFAGDSVGGVPSGWSVYGTNPGFDVTNDGGHVYDHNGWTASTSTGNSGWANYTLTASFKPADWASENNGVAFRYQDGKDFYALNFVGGHELVLGKNVNDGSWSGKWTTLAQEAFPYTSSWYTVTITVTGSTIVTSINGTPALGATDSSLGTGAVGFDANAPAEYRSIKVVAG
jgi:hypothetical protein